MCCVALIAGLCALRFVYKALDCECDCLPDTLCSMSGTYVRDNNYICSDRPVGAVDGFADRCRYHKEFHGQKVDITP